MENLYLRIHALFDRVARVAVWAGGASLLVCAIMVTGDVISRKWFGFTISGSDEISGYAFAASTTWAYSYCLLHRANIRIDALYNLLPNLLKAVLDVVGLLLLFGVMVMLTDRAIDVLSETLINESTANSTLQTPLWIPQGLWLGGLILFCLTLAFVSLFALLFLLRGNLPMVRRAAGVLSIEEEIDEETHGMGSRLSKPDGRT